MEDDILKCDGQWPKIIYALAILMKFLRHVLSLIITLRCFQDNLLGLEVNELLHFVIEILNSSSENGIYFVTGLFGISSDNFRWIWQFYTELNNKCRAYHRSLSSKYSQPLYWIASLAGSLYFLTQFMSFQGPQFFCNFLNLSIKKNVFSLFDDILKVPPIFNSLWNFVSLKFPLMLLILLWFWVFCDIDNFWIFEPNFVSIFSEFLYCLFKSFLAWDVFHV